MNPTHADIIKQQVEEFFKKFPHLYGSLYIDFLTQFANTIAQATEKAGEVEEDEYEDAETDDDFTENNTFDAYDTLGHAYAGGYNACRAQSRRQLDEYFGRNAYGPEAYDLFIDSCR